MERLRGDGPHAAEMQAFARLSTTCHLERVDGMVARVRTL
jgi:hypothetical protein